MGFKKSKAKKQAAEKAKQAEAEELESAKADAAAASDDEEVIQDEIGELKARLQRSVADLQNFRKQSEKRLADSRRFIQRDMFRDLLPIVDNFGAALAASDQGQDAESVLVGVRMIHDMLLKMLADNGVEAIPAAEGNGFDPELHDAISRQETEEVEPDTILTEVLRGYRMKDLVVRPSRVVVAARPAPPAEEEEAATDEVVEADTQDADKED